MTTGVKVSVCRTLYDTYIVKVRDDRVYETGNKTKAEGVTEFLAQWFAVIPYVDLPPKPPKPTHTARGHVLGGRHTAVRSSLSCRFHERNWQAVADSAQI